MSLHDAAQPACLLQLQEDAKGPTTDTTRQLLLQQQKQLPRSAPWALRHISLHPATTHCAALRQLLGVAEERRRQAFGDGDAEVEALRSRLVEWPLSTLTRCVPVLRFARGLVREWITAVAASSLRQKQQQQQQQQPLRYRRLYNICLWQRRHPLFILTSVLDAFSSQLSCEEIDDMLEALSQHLAGPLSRIPHLLRCDVLMTYHRLPLTQQQQLMEALRPAYSTETSPSPPAPALYVGGHARTVPPRFGEKDLRAEQYAELRRAFELHKQAGVRRLLSCVS
ncbi:hypothetical protein DQ04_03301010 [Trypanosoma grayi]|uniref:hypothetical protein n=1 Tax=Trypanosoma grayi TaxID=71804 RepID=UPI0004F4799A|nr:hypothetical protein DQ04_03301010 [Trypanosoma grayi]KEG10773.1 hypothetical protein DQ04_03301010 [Trypanosoma grayi]